MIGLIIEVFCHNYAPVWVQESDIIINLVVEDSVLNDSLSITLKGWPSGHPTNK